MSDFVKVRISSDFDAAGINRAQADLGKLSETAKEFTASLKTGLGIDLAGRGVQALASLPGILESVIARGVAFNITMTDSEAGMARVLGKFLNLNEAAAKNEAAKAMRQIAELEPKTAGTLETLVQGFMSTSAAALSAGMSVEQNIDLVGKFANALSNANIPAEQLSQELRSIFTGNITSDSALAKILTITPADVARAKEAGNLFAFLTEKVGTLGDAGDGFAVRWSTLQSAIDKSLATISRPIFDAIFASLEKLTSEINRPETVEGLRKLGYELGNAAQNGAELLAWAVRNAPALAGLAHGAATVGAALAAMGLARLVISLGAWAASLVTVKVATDAETASTMRQIAAVEAETAALAANTGARAANAAGRTAGAAAGGLGVGGAAGIATAGIGIGAAIYAYRTQKANGDTAAAQANDGLVDSLGKQQTLLMDQVRAASEAKAQTEARKAVEQQIVEIRSRMNLLDDEGQVIAKRGIFNLEHMLSRFDTLAGSRPTAAPAESIADQSEAWEKVTKTLKGDWVEIAGLADEPAKRAEALAMKLAILRDQYNEVAKGEADPTASGQDLLTLASTATDPKQMAEASRIAVEIAKVQKEIGDQKQRQQDLDDKAQEAANEKLKKERERQAAQDAMLADLSSELEIQKALVTGDTQKAGELERQRKLAADIASINKSDLTPEAKAQATALAQQTSELQKQKALKDAEVARAGVDADQQLADAQNGPSKRKLREAQLNKFKMDRFESLRGQLGENEAWTAAERATATEAARMKRESGTIGGSVTKADPRTNIGAIASGFDMLKPIGDSVALRPANAPELPPLDGSRLAAPPSTVGADGPANALQAAGKAGESANKKLEKLAIGLEQTLGTTGEKAASIENTAQAISNKLDAILSALGNLGSRVETLEVNSYS